MITDKEKKLAKQMISRYNKLDKKLNKMGVKLAEYVQRHANSKEELLEIQKTIPPGYASYILRVFIKGLE